MSADRHATLSARQVRLAQARPAVLLGLVVLGLHALSLWRFQGALWGCDSYAFLPGWCYLVATAVAIAGVLFVLSGGVRERGADSSASKVHHGASSLLPVGIGIVAAAVMWTFRVRHLLYGDGLPLTASVLSGQGFNALEPLTALIQSEAFDIFRSVGSSHMPPTYEAAWQSIALGSVLAGGCFAAVVWSLAREMGSDTRPIGVPALPPDSLTGAMRFGLMVSQGYVLLFFGYVENYAYYTLALAVYLLFSIRFLQGRARLLPAGMTLVVSFFLHLSAAALLPSFVVLVIHGLRGCVTRRRTIVDALGCATLFAAMVTWFAYSSPGYVMPRTLLATTRTLLGPGSTMSSSDHLRDFVNELLLIGPVGAWVFATGLMLIMRRRERVDAVQGFLIVVGLTYLGACWLAGDSNLGYARNWDLLAPAGFVLTAAGVGLDGWKIPAGRPAPYLAILLVISAYQTIPWIAVNASEPRAIRRFASLPLGAGRAESTIGYWHALRGRDAEAEVWLKRAVAASPGNVRAHVFLGKLYFDQRRYGPALAEYRRAVALRPDLADLRLRAGEAARSDSLIRDGRVSP